jgi:hypothetical protein
MRRTGRKVIVGGDVNKQTKKCQYSLLHMVHAVWYVFKFHTSKCEVLVLVLAIEFPISDLCGRGTTAID